MKRLVIAICLVLLFAFGANAQNWISTNQSTVSWDATTDLVGNPIPPNDSISYRVYLKKMPNGPEVVVDDTDQLQYTITFGVEGRYIVGVQTVRVPENETEEVLSSITWSDSTDVVAVPNPFGIVYFESPLNPKGFIPVNP